MKKIFFILLFSVFTLSACGSANPAKQDNNATVTKTGTVTMKSGDEWLLKTDNGIVNITSNKVDLDSYIKKNISVTGQFSGSTLYVDEIK